MDSNEGRLWAGVFNASAPDSTEGVIPFFDRQCENIEEYSGGRVHARFKKLEIVERKTPGALSAAGLAVSFTDRTVREEKDALQLEDANDFYDPSDYVFDVYSDKYKFRVLTLKLGMVYPVRGELDSGIAEELKANLKSLADPIDRNKGIWIHDEDELGNLIELIVTKSRKFRAILVKMTAGQ